MTSDPTVFAGVDLSSGRKPVTFAALDVALNVIARHKWSLEETAASLKEYDPVLLTVNSASPEKSAELKKVLVQAGFKTAAKQSPFQWMETDVQPAFLALCAKKLLSRRTLEGQIQRALILYDEGLRIPDPMDFFEEITRHRLMQGVLPLENIFSVRELDALLAAYVSWMFVNEPRKVQLTANHVSVVPRSEE